MVASMTGFARRTKEGPWGTLVWEVRSVNHRFLEVGMRLPEALRQAEVAARQQIQKVLKRGKVDGVLKFSPGEKVPFEIVVNKALVQQLANAAKVVAQHFPESQVNQLDVLNWHGVIETKQTEMDIVAENALALLQEVLQDLLDMRQREGQGLKTFIAERLQTLSEQASQIEQRLPSLHQQARDKVVARFAELSLEVESERLEQEMVWLVQKMDVAEEIQRLYAHVTEVTRTLDQGGAIGRRLDFLMQELNREANTLGSKSSDSAVTQAVVELKVQIEQMREQVQNIE